VYSFINTEVLKCLSLSDQRNAAYLKNEFALWKLITCGRCVWSDQMNAMMQSNSSAMSSTDDTGGLVFDKMGGPGDRPYQARATSSYQQDNDLQVGESYSNKANTTGNQSAIRL